MLFSLFELLSFFQPEATGATGGGGAASGSGGGGGLLGGGCETNLAMMAVMMAIFYFMLIRPQQKRQREHEAMLKAIRRGSIVRTTGGIRGEVVTVDDEEVTLLIAEKVKINILRSAIAGVVTPTTATETGKDAKDKPASDKGAARAG